MRDLTRHTIFNWGRASHPVKQDGALQGLVHLLAGWQSDEELKRLKWLARDALVAKSDILEIREAMLVQTGPKWDQTSLHSEP